MCICFYLLAAEPRTAIEAIASPLPEELRGFAKEKNGIPVHRVLFNEITKKGCNRGLLTIRVRIDRTGGRASNRRFGP